MVKQEDAAIRNDGGATGPAIRSKLGSLSERSAGEPSSQPHEIIDLTAADEIDGDYERSSGAEKLLGHSAVQVGVMDLDANPDQAERNAPHKPGCQRGMGDAKTGDGPGSSIECGIGGSTLSSDMLWAPVPSPLISADRVDATSLTLVDKDAMSASRDGPLHTLPPLAPIAGPFGFLVAPALALPGAMRGADFIVPCQDEADEPLPAAPLIPPSGPDCADVLFLGHVEEASKSLPLAPSSSPSVAAPLGNEALLASCKGGIEKAAAGPSSQAPALPLPAWEDSVGSAGNQTAMADNHGEGQNQQQDPLRPGPTGRSAQVIEAMRRAMLSEAEGGPAWLTVPEIRERMGRDEGFQFTTSQKHTRTRLVEHYLGKQDVKQIVARMQPPAKPAKYALKESLRCRLCCGGEALEVCSGCGSAWHTGCLAGQSGRCGPMLAHGRCSSCSATAEPSARVEGGDAAGATCASETKAAPAVSSVKEETQEGSGGNAIRETRGVVAQDDGGCKQSTQAEPAQDLFEEAIQRALVDSSSGPWLSARDIWELLEGYGTAFPESWSSSSLRRLSCIKNFMKEISGKGGGILKKQYTLPTGGVIDIRYASKDRVTGGGDQALSNCKAEGEGEGGAAAGSLNALGSSQSRKRRGADRLGRNDSCRSEVSWKRPRANSTRQAFHAAIDQALRDGARGPWLSARDIFELLEESGTPFLPHHKSSADRLAYVACFMSNLAKKRLVAKRQCEREDAGQISKRRKLVTCYASKALAHADPLKLPKKLPSKAMPASLRERVLPAIRKALSEHPGGPWLSFDAVRDRMQNDGFRFETAAAENLVRSSLENQHREISVQSVDAKGIQLRHPRFALRCLLPASEPGSEDLQAADCSSESVSDGPPTLARCSGRQGKAPAVDMVSSDGDSSDSSASGGTSGCRSDRQPEPLDQEVLAAIERAAGGGDGVCAGPWMTVAQIRQCLEEQGFKLRSKYFVRSFLGRKAIRAQFSQDTRRPAGAPESARLVQHFALQRLLGGARGASSPLNAKGPAKGSEGGEGLAKDNQGLLGAIEQAMMRHPGGPWMTEPELRTSIMAQGWWDKNKSKSQIWDFIKKANKTNRDQFLKRPAGLQEGRRQNCMQIVLRSLLNGNNAGSGSCIANADAGAPTLQSAGKSGPWTNLVIGNRRWYHAAEVCSAISRAMLGSGLGPWLDCKSIRDLMVDQGVVQLPSKHGHIQLAFIQQHLEPPPGSCIAGRFLRQAARAAPEGLGGPPYKYAVPCTGCRALPAELLSPGATGEAWFCRECQDGSHSRPGTVEASALEEEEEEEVVLVGVRNKVPGAPQGSSGAPRLGDALGSGLATVQPRAALDSNQQAGTTAKVLCKPGLRRETYNKYAGKLRTAAECLDLLRRGGALPDGVYTLVEEQMNNLCELAPGAQELLATDVLLAGGLRHETYRRWASKLLTVDACLKLLEKHGALPDKVYELVDDRMECLDGQFSD